MPAEPDVEREAPESNGQRPPKLLKFRDRTGINTPGVLAHQHGQRPGPNVGIYARVIQEEWKTKYQYHLVSAIINTIFIGQILVAAALTALGASNTSHIAITILGSVNTVIAGVQTYLKGQGLPNRLHQYEFGLRKLREYIEDRERELTDPDSKLDVDHEVSEISAMYSAVRQTAEDNAPDTYLPMGGAGKKLLGEKSRTKDARTLPAANSTTEPEPSNAVSRTDSALFTSSGKDATNAQAEGAKGKEMTLSKDEEGEGSGTNPNHKDETEEAPLLHERRVSR